MKRKLQVFVSSTYTDLIEERQAAVAAILKAGHIPAGMELFTAGDKSQMKTIERWIDESDVYMLILGGRYGSIESTTGLSYTELEYDYAASRGKPSFSVVITEEALETKVKSGGSLFLEKNNPKSLSQFREKILSNISSFFTDAKDVKLCVYESMSDFATSSDLKGWIAADEIPDSKALQEEIRTLREENLALARKVKNQETLHPPGKDESTISKEAELVQVLKKIEVKIPENLTSDKKGSVNSLFRIAYSNRDTLINGVTNSINASGAETFFYFSVIPKLQAHGLADNEKVPGAKYRRGFLNRKGQALFASVEKQNLLAKVTKDLAPSLQNIEKTSATPIKKVSVKKAITRKKET